MGVTGSVLEWEKPLVELEKRIAEMQAYAREKGIDISDEIATLARKAERLREEIYANLTPWQKVMLARHPRRPTTLDYIEMICEDFVELHGDRTLRDDAAIVTGIGLLGGRPVTVVGSQKGRDTKENIRRNFGMPHPEGYRKALRAMLQAEKFGRPILSLIDVVGAYPGIEAEQRGQGVMIAEAIRRMSFLQVPIVCVITGEGGSGGALALGVGDEIWMLEHAWYSVISPEMCAQILWGDPARAAEAAAVMRLTAQDLLQLGVIDGVIPEPLGGAHRDREGAAANLKETVLAAFARLEGVPGRELVERRLRRFRQVGAVTDALSRQLTGSGPVGPVAGLEGVPQESHPGARS